MLVLVLVLVLEVNTRTRTRTRSLILVLVLVLEKVRTCPALLLGGDFFTQHRETPFAEMQTMS